MSRPWPAAAPPAPVLSVESDRERYKYFEGANIVRLEKQFKEWLYGSAGYLYSQLNADAAFNLDSHQFTGPSVGSDLQWRMPQITLEKESHVFNVSSLLGPFAGLATSAGVQTEWTREQSFGNGALNTVGRPVNPTSLASDYDLFSVSENLGLRYSKIPYTTLFAEGRLQQQTIGQSGHLSAPQNPLKGVFMQRTDFSSDTSDLRAGFSTSPWQSVFFSAHYRRYEINSHYDNDPLIQPPPITGYPTFIDARDVLNHEIEAKLVLRPSSWLKTTFAYQYLISGYWTDTDPFTDNAVAPRVTNNITAGGRIFSGRETSSIYTFGATLTPWQRIYLDASFSYQPTYVRTADHGTSAHYQGDIYTVVASGTYVCTEKMDLFASYSFSRADFGSAKLASQIPVGLEYKQHAVQAGIAWRLSKNATAHLQYGYYHYDEPSIGLVNRYDAHSVFASIGFKLP